MPDANHVLIFSRSYIESGMANVNQTLHMAQALGKLTQVDVYMRTQRTRMAGPILSKLVGQQPSFKFNGKNTPAILFTVGFCFGLLGKSRNRTIVYTRSLVVGMIGRLFGFRTGVELHQDRLSQSHGLSQVLAFLLRRPFFGRRLHIIVISNALKSIIREKYGDISSIQVMHDAAVPPAENLQALSKRERPLIVYTGMLANERSVDKLVELAADFPTCDFRLIGGDRQQIAYYRDMAEKLGAGNIRVFLRQGYNRISYYQCKADILIAFWSVDVPTMNYCSPLKLFEYLQTGNAILVHDFPVLHEVLPDSPLIALASPTDTGAAREALKNLLQSNVQPKTRAQLKNYGNRFTYDARARQLLDGFDKVEQTRAG